MNRKEALPLYRDGRHYDLLNADVAADIPFYCEEAAGSSGPVLELACGTGRLLLPIAQRGVEITGLDQSRSMLDHARAKMRAAGVEIPLVLADCRNFELGRKFGLIFMGFNSLQHLHDFESLQALFRNVKKHLAEGGRFTFDVFNPKISLLTRDAGRRYFEREYPDPEADGTIMLEQTAVYDDAAQVNRITWYFSRLRCAPDGTRQVVEKDFRVEALHMRCFYPEELNLLVRSQGFAIDAKFGNFERKPFAGGDPKQIVVCRAA